jgi:hypothetical protein
MHHVHRLPFHAVLPAWDLSPVNSGKQAPKAAMPPRSVQWGCSRHPGPTLIRALPHHEETDLRTGSVKRCDRHATVENRFIEGGSAAGRWGSLMIEVV